MTLRRAGTIFLVGSCLIVGFASVSSAAVRISKVYYNSPGAENGSDRSLNAEWVQITNQGTSGARVWKWTVRDSGGHRFRFPNIKLKPGQSIRVHTGPGFDSYGDKVIQLYWGSSSYIWNNDTDTATLRRSTGTVATRCHYDDPSVSFKVC